MLAVVITTHARIVKFQLFHRVEVRIQALPVGACVGRVVLILVGEPMAIPLARFVLPCDAWKSCQRRKKRDAKTKGEVRTARSRGKLREFLSARSPDLLP